MDGYNLNLQSYCSYCKDFCPELEQRDVTCYMDSVRKTANDICCKNKDKCARMMATIESKILIDNAKEAQKSIAEKIKKLRERVNISIE